MLKPLNILSKELNIDNKVLVNNTRNINFYIKIYIFTQFSGPLFNKYIYIKS